MTAHGHFHWNELMTSDVEKAKAFYGKTVGWTFDPMPMPNGTYWVAMVNGTPVAGLMDMAGVTPPGTPPHWFAYLNVDDVDKRIEQLKANGGKVHREPWDIPGVGRVAIVEDATGAPMGWMTASA